MASRILNSSNSLYRGHECDRQTDHSMEKYLAIVRIACAARVCIIMNAEFIFKHFASN